MEHFGFGSCISVPYEALNARSLSIYYINLWYYLRNFLVVLDVY